MSDCQYLRNKKLWLDEVTVKGTFLKEPSDCIKLYNILEKICSYGIIHFYKRGVLQCTRTQSIKFPHMNFAVPASKVADPDPNSAFHLIRIQIRLSNLMLIRIRILLLIKVMRICDHWYTDPQGLHLEPPRLNCERPRPSLLHFYPLKL
jgi:hypothetical protein